MAGAALIIRRALSLPRTEFNCTRTHNWSQKYIYPTQNAFACCRNLSVSPVLDIKLVQYSYKCAGPSIKDCYAGIVAGAYIVEIFKLNPSLPLTVLDILRCGCLDQVKCLKPTPESLIHHTCVNLKAPITGMDKVLCLGLNYKDHCKEYNLKPPKEPMFFSKFTSCIIGPSEYLRLRCKSTKVDWEVELAVVIGKLASEVKSADAFNYIAGYTVAQDISDRYWQKEKNEGQFLLGKAMDTFCPLGPCITTSDEIGDPQKLVISCFVNGVLKQCSVTDQLIHKIDAVIEQITSLMTLFPGDIILTGTPAGVGVYRNPPEFIRHGDVIDSWIENIGILRIIASQY